MNYEFITKGYIFRQLDKIAYKQIMFNYNDLVVFIGTQVMQAFRDGLSCVITTEEDEVMFYMEKGQVKFSSNEKLNWESLFQMMIEG